MIYYLKAQSIILQIVLVLSSLISGILGYYQGIAYCFFIELGMLFNSFLVREEVQGGEGK